MGYKNNPDRRDARIAYFTPFFVNLCLSQQRKGGNKECRESLIFLEYSLILQRL